MKDIQNAVEVSSVYKNFVLPHERTDSIKSLFISPFKKRMKAETQHALKDISFSVKKGEFFGIVGRNGSGKSTLLKMIAGIYQPSSGTIDVEGRLVPFIELGVGFNPELTGRENVFLNGALMGFSRKEIFDKYDAIVDFAEIKTFMDQKLKNYSSGMQVRLAFSVATILAESDVLIIDEVLAVGDASFQKKCFAYFRQLKKAKKTVIFVSHDMNAVLEYCDRAILIEGGDKIIDGSTAEVAAAYNRMFNDPDAKKSNLAKVKKRWGTEEVTIKSIDEKPTLIKAVDEKLRIGLTIQAKKVFKGKVIAGFKIKDSDNKPLIGTNTHIKKIDIDLIDGAAAHITWDIPVIFNDGFYSIDIVLESENYNSTFDFWTDAIKFEVQRKEQSSYEINPVITTKLEHVTK